MAEVRRLDGGKYEHDGAGPAPVPEVVEVLEQALADAKAGNLYAVAMAMVSPDGVCSEQWAMAIGRGHETMAAIGYLQHRYVSEAMAKSVPIPPTDSA